MGELDGRERVGAAMAAGSVVLIGGSVAASSLVAGFPVLGGQAVRYLAAALLLAALARLRRVPLPWPTRREWAWLIGLAGVGLAGLSVVMIKATQLTDPARVGVIIGAAPLVIVLANAVAARRRPTRQLVVAAGLVTVGASAAQLGDVSGASWNWAGLLLSIGALGGVVASSLFAAPVLPRLGALAVTVYSCTLAGVGLLVAATALWWAGSGPVLRGPTRVELGALIYLAVAVTAVVFVAWYGAIERLGVERTGLFNGLIPIASLAAVALVGTGTVTPVRAVGAAAVLFGVLLGLGAAKPATGVNEPSTCASDRRLAGEPRSLESTRPLQRTIDRRAVED